MDPELINPGPIDPSVLYDQDNHVSSAIWDGQERGVLRCHEHTSKLSEWRLVPKQIELVEKAGFGYLRQLPSISLDNPLISALVERWRRETNTFHFTVGEMTITLKDVALLLGLPIDGEPVLGVTYTSCKSVCERYLGRVPEAGYMSGGMVKLSWLKEYFSHCSEGASLEVIEYHTRAYLLYLVGSTIFSTTTGNKVPVMYLPLFEDFEKAGRFAWGAAALSFLYRSLGNASLKSQSTISGCLTLLQCWSYFYLNIGRPKFYQEPLHDCFPLVFWWKGKQSAATLKRDIIFYRKALDSLKPCDVKWLPFNDVDSTLIPENISNSLILGRSKTMLICFDKAERHLPDRCLRQHGMLQGIPECVQQWERKSRGVDSGIHLSGKMESEINEWSARRLHIVQGDDAEQSEYMHWYMSITRKLVGRPASPLSQFQRTVKFRTKKKRMNTGLRDIAHIADMFSTKGLDPLQVESISRIRAIAHACLGDEVESTTIVSSSAQIEPAKRREKERVRRNTNGKRKRRDDEVQFNTDGEDEQVLLYGSTVDVDQMQLCHAISKVDQSHQTIDCPRTTLGKRIRRREKTKKKTNRKLRHIENLVKCDAVIKDLQSHIYADKDDQMHPSSKDYQFRVASEGQSMQLSKVDVDLDNLQLQPSHNIVEGEEEESHLAAGEGEKSNSINAAGLDQNLEGETVELLLATVESEKDKSSHAASEGENDNLSPTNVESFHAGGEGQTTESLCAADESEKDKSSHSAAENKRTESSNVANESEEDKSSYPSAEDKRAGASDTVDEKAGSSHEVGEHKGLSSSGEAGEQAVSSQADTYHGSDKGEKLVCSSAAGEDKKEVSSLEVTEENKEASSIATEKG